MKGLISTFIFLITINSWSQEIREIPLSKDSDTTYWSGYVNRELKKFDIGPIKNNSGYTFRLSSYGSIIEIQKVNQSYFGAITYFVNEVDDSREDERTFKKTYSIKNSEVEKLFSLIDSTQIKQIPSDKFIKNWEHGFDGITYFFESKNDSEYSFKNYWTPTSQNIAEATKVQNFIDSFYRVININQYSEIFRKEVPFRSYSYNGGSSVIITPMTQEEYKEYKKRKRKKDQKNK
jgi:hypothetical protein